MKLFSYIKNNSKPLLGLANENMYYDISSQYTASGEKLPASMLEYLQSSDETKMGLKEFANNTKTKGLEPIDPGGIRIVAPLPNPTSCRDAYAFRQHVQTARRNRGLDMIEEFDQFPVFYFTNHNAVCGPGDVILEKDHFEKLDFELELAIIIGKKGRNIPAEKADEYIAGFTIMNDLSARVLQMEEMKLSLGPAKGKDFSTAIGPWLVTPDELQEFSTKTDKGLKYNLKMTARHNNILVSHGNAIDMHWTFAEIIERCSYGVDLFPGDVIGSGTVGTGCYLELNGTAALNAKEKGVSFTPVWLEPNDEISLSIEGLGTLTNKMILSDNNLSLLEKKRQAYDWVGRGK